MKSKVPRLTKSDWAEVFYALQTKRVAILKGQYAAPIDSDFDAQGWADHLGKISEKIRKVVRV